MLQIPAEQLRTMTHGELVLVILRLEAEIKWRDQLLDTLHDLLAEYSKVKNVPRYHSPDRL